MQHLLRRKITFLFLFILPAIGFAQRKSPNLPNFDDKPLHFGINLGINSAHFHFTHSSYFLSQDSVLNVEGLNNLGLNLAWLVNLRLNQNFCIRTYPLDLTFSQKSFQYALLTPNTIADETPIMIKSVQSVTLSLPVQLEFNSDRINDFRVYTIVGGQVNLDLASTAGDKNTTGTIDLKKFDYGVQCGIGFHLYYPFFVLSPELRAEWGLANLHSKNSYSKFSNVVDKVTSRMISFSITIE